MRLRGEISADGVYLTQDIFSFLSNLSLLIDGICIISLLFYVLGMICAYPPDQEEEKELVGT